MGEASEKPIEKPLQRSFLVIPGYSEPAEEAPPKDPPKPKRKRKGTSKLKIAPLLGEGGRIDWNTPRIIVDLVRKVGRGTIGLDPCSNPQSIVGATTAFSLETGENGLERSWGGFGLVYVNPPYGDAIVPWITKAAKEGGRNSPDKNNAFGEFSTEIVSLLPARTDTLWYGAVWRSARCVAFWRGRLVFLGAPDPAPFPSILPYYGPNPYLFADIFSPYAEIAFCL